MYYLIEPLDNFFFRTSVPFEAGGETTAIESLDMPLPSVYAGAFKNLLGTNSGVDGKIQIGFNGLFLENEFLLPVPADLSWQEGTESDCGDSPKGDLERIGTMELTPKPVSNFPLKYCLCQRGGHSKKKKEPKNLFMPDQEIEAYLNAEKAEFSGIDLDDRYLVKEEKVGIAVDAGSGTSKEHQLYQISMVRPAKDQELKLAADVRIRKRDMPGCKDKNKETGGIHDSKTTGVVRFGGEGKLAFVKEGPCSLQIKVKQEDAKYFKIYLATPAIFEKGWLPGWVDENRLEGMFTFKERQVKVRLLAACVGRYIPCGGFGFDKEEDRYHPREMRFAVPAGSVYYFELLSGTFADAVKLFHGKCMSDYRESKGFEYPKYKKYRYCDRGFGYALVGKLRKEQEEIIHG